MQSSDFDPLRPHVPLNVMDASLEQMTDEKKATKSEIQAIYKVYPETQSCRRNAAESLEPLTPSIVSIMVDEWQRWDTIEISLVKRKISWGEAITKAKNTAIETNKELTGAWEKIDSQLQQSHMAEIQQRQQAFSNYMQYLQNQQLINSVNRPRTTNCMGSGNVVNCTTY